jgi:hypothetical protein
MTLKFEFSDPSVLDLSLKLNFYDANKKMISGIGLAIDKSGFITLPQKYIDLISYFPYPMLIKSGNSNIASVLIDSEQTLKRCLEYTGAPQPYNTLIFYINRTTGIVKTAFMAEKDINLTRETAAALTDSATKELSPEKTPGSDVTTKPIDPIVLNAATSMVSAQASDRTLKGKIADLQGQPIKNTAFILYVQELSERATKDIKMIPLLSGKSDNMGVFSVKVPGKNYGSAYATVGAAVNKPIAIHLEDGKLPSFALLLVDDISAVSGSDSNDDDCDCHKAPPARLPEMEDLVGADSNYQQDIGGSCVNFTTPNRALEEFSYYSVVRLTDPEVMNAPGYVENLKVRIAQLEKAIADLKVRNAKEDKINGVGTQDPLIIPNILIPELQKIIQNAANYKNSAELEAAFTSAINKAIQGGEGVSPEITKVRPSATFPQFFGFPVTKVALITAAFTNYINQQNSYRSALMAQAKYGDRFNSTSPAVTPAQESLLQNVAWMEMELTKMKAELAIASSRTNLGKMRQKISINNQVQWDAPMPIVQPASIAHGHLLCFRQVWRADGYSMGDLLYSLPLAPGQQKQIAIHDWDRRDTASRSEVQSIEESLTNTLSQDRDINEIIKSSLREDIEAQSKAKTSGISMGAGSAVGAAATIPVGGIPISAKVGFSGGFSMGSGSSSSSASQNSSRDLSGSTMQNIREKTMQTASSLRSQRSTIITTVSQSETTTVTTESIANYNHCHAITIQYFEVLRHLAVYNELVDVQECLFVPLTMSLFDDSKVVRWTDLLKPALRTPAHRFERLLKAFDSIRRYYEINVVGRPAAEVYYNMPSGRYCDEKIRELSGSMRIKINFTCPKKATKSLDDRTADSIAKIVGAGIATALTGIPVEKLGGILGGLGAGHRQMINDLLIDQDADRKNWKDQLGFIAEVEDIRIKVNRTADDKREEVFQAEIQRVNAVAQFAKYLKIVVGTPAIQSIHARVALTRKGNAKNAKINGEAPIYDFSFRTVSGRFSRERDEIVSFGVSCDYTNSLPEGSTLVVEHIQAGYQSDYLTAVLCNDRPSDDLLAGPVMIYTPMTEAEMVSPRAEDLRLRNELLDHLNSNMEYYHKSIWVQMDADRRLMLLEGFEIDIPARENPAYAPGNGQPQYLFPARTVSVASVVENRLIGIAGNSLIMPVAKGFNLNPVFRFAGDEVEIDGKKMSRLMSYYMPERGFKDTPFRISVPTKGVFAEAVMGACNSCEKIDNTRYWKWEEHPIPNSPAAINPVGVDSRYQENNLLTPTQMAESLLKLQEGKSLPDPTGLAKAFENLTKSDMFKDMTGLEGNQKNAIEALKSQTEAAREYAKNAADLAKSMEIPKSADGVADSIKRNVKNPEKQQALIEKYFDNMLSGGSNAKGGGTEGGETDEGSGGQSDPIRRAAGKALDKMGDGGKGRMKTEFPDGTKLEMESEGSTASTQEEEFLDIEDELSAELQDFENRFVNQTPGTGTGTSSTTPNNQ